VCLISQVAHTIYCVIPSACGVRPYVAKVRPPNYMEIIYRMLNLRKRISPSGVDCPPLAIRHRQRFVNSEIFRWPKLGRLSKDD